jgi:MinD superfamily P-loop ATPase
LLGKISYDKKVMDCIVNLKPVITSDSKVVNEIAEIFERMKEKMSESN